MKIRLISNSKMSSTSNWFNELTDKAKKMYIEKHPDSKYAKRAREKAQGKMEERQSYKFREVDEALVKFFKDAGKTIPKRFIFGASSSVGVTMYSVDGGKPQKLLELSPGESRSIQKRMEDDVVIKLPSEVLRSVLNS